MTNALLSFLLFLFRRSLPNAPGFEYGKCRFSAGARYYGAQEEKANKRRCLVSGMAKVSDVELLKARGCLSLEGDRLGKICLLDFS